jgi:hypothetical protein
LERVSNLSKITQLESDRAGTCSLFFLLDLARSPFPRFSQIENQPLFPSNEVHTSQPGSSTLGTLGAEVRERGPCQADVHILDLLEPL